MKSAQLLAEISISWPLIVVIAIVGMRMAEEIFAWPQFGLLGIAFSWLEHFVLRSEDPLNKLRVALLIALTALQVFLQIEISLTINPRLFATCVDRHRRMAPDDKVGVFTDFE